MSSSDGDWRQRFLFEYANVRGELIRLDQALLALLARRTYPPVIARQLGEAMAAAGLLSSTLKFDGSLILQVRGDGSLQTLVASATHDRDLRAVARLRDGADEAGLSGTTRMRSLGDLAGSGYLAITLDPDDGGERYQGIVSLTPGSLAETIETYFEQSEQLPTRLWLASDGRRAAGLLLQRLPGHDHGDPDAWDRARHLAATITDSELLDVAAGDVLFRLFHEEIVRVFDPQSLRFHCHCSRDRVGRALRAMGDDDIRALLQERGGIEADCEFCGQQYRFDRVDVEQLLQAAGTAADTTRH